MSDSNFAVDFARETWALYGSGVLVISLRFFARIRRLGLRNLQLDDYVMVNGLVWYTILCVSLNMVASGGGSNLLKPEDIAALTPDTIQERIAGSKWVFVSEQAMLLAVWSMKSCMLIIFYRLTQGLSQRKLVTWLSCYVALGFLGSELALFLSCRPLAQYWAVPAADPQCSSYQHYEIAQACFHITGDLCMLCISIPLLISVRLPLHQKVILLIIFGMGIFVVIAAVLTKVYCLVPALISYVYMNWYFREASVAVYVTNLPFLWTLLRDVVPELDRWTSTAGRGHDGDGPSSAGSKRLAKWKQSLKSGNTNTTSTSTSSGDYDLNSYNRRGEEEEADDGGGRHLTARESREKMHHSVVLEIKRDVTFTVERVVASADDDGDSISQGHYHSWAQTLK